MHASRTAEQLCTHTHTHNLDEPCTQLCYKPLPVLSKLLAPRLNGREIFCIHLSFLHLIILPICHILPWDRKPTHMFKQPTQLLFTSFSSQYVETSSPPLILLIPVSLMSNQALFSKEVNIVHCTTT